MALLPPPAKKDTQKGIWDNKIQNIANFLLEHYEIRVSVQDPTKVYIKCKDADRKHITPDISRISNHLASNDHHIGDTQLRKILNDPYYIPHCDPITEYFNSVRGKWNGVSQIDILCNCIVARDFGDKPTGWYQDRLKKLIKKWLVACVATWLSDELFEQNDVIFGLIQAVGGAGKTSLIKFLPPEPLTDYIIDASQDEKKFDIEDAYTRYMFVNFEENSGIKKSTINTLKKVQSANFIVTKLRNEYVPTNKRRIGNGFLSNNFNQENGGFIEFWYGSDTRRFGLAEIISIDQNYSKLIDKDQLYAELITMYESCSFDFIFDKTDYEDFNIYNSRYKIETDAMKSLQRYVRPPEAGEEGEKLNPTQIMQRLISMNYIKSEELQKITAQKIGQALTALGYEQISFRSPAHNNDSIKGYNVVFIKKE